MACLPIDASDQTQIRGKLCCAIAKKNAHGNSLGIERNYNILNKRRLPAPEQKATDICGG